MIIVWFWLVIILGQKEALTAGYRDYIVVAACCIKEGPGMSHPRDHPQTPKKS